MLWVLKASCKPRAHLGTVGEGKESLKPQRCLAAQQVPSTPGSVDMKLDPVADKPPAQAAPLYMGASAAPTGKHPKQVNSKEPGFSQGTSHGPPPPKGKGRQGLHCITCISLVSRPSQLKQQLPPGQTHAPPLDPACARSTCTQQPRSCLWPQHPKTCLQTQNEHPRPYQGTQHPNPAHQILPLRSAPELSAARPDCGPGTLISALRPYLRMQHPDPVTRLSSPDPAYGLSTQTQHPQPCLWIQHPNPTCACRTKIQ
ncbi:uncharacterized protein LOC128852656 [Cuculus canorus]|uniref:uncharacterized protein LOC128852656 n=1 Tax=Cuculus canorus TaxID=55661 RepID=UPI0023AACF16|nr:uncharacterized protein LOC128852656 [Cuculus canorus]